MLKLGVTGLVCVGSSRERSDSTIAGKSEGDILKFYQEPAYAIISPVREVPLDLPAARATEQPQQPNSASRLLRLTFISVNLGCCVPTYSGRRLAIGNPSFHGETGYSHSRGTAGITPERGSPFHSVPGLKSRL
jgi:hypothetical protein